jgi:hypothetical protein
MESCTSVLLPQRHYELLTQKNIIFSDNISVCKKKIERILHIVCCYKVMMMMFYGNVCYHNKVALFAVVHSFEMKIFVWEIFSISMK